MRITVDLPEGLMEAVMELGGFRTKRAAAIAALQECVKRRRDPEGASGPAKPLDAWSGGQLRRMRTEDGGSVSPKSTSGPSPTRPRRGRRT